MANNSNKDQDEVIGHFEAHETGPTKADFGYSSPKADFGYQEKSKEKEPLTPEASDKQLEEKIAGQLARAANIEATPIDIEAVDGQVVLKGAAVDQKTIEQIESLALKVDGVKSISNQIKILRVVPNQQSAQG